ncbi:hypothetical protein G6F59_016946 [Rhizopus arrhizus]|nr:hypothetical protein G6F59_016946 [Rhizopus arrhizus]
MPALVFTGRHRMPGRGVAAGRIALRTRTPVDGLAEQACVATGCSRTGRPPAAGRCRPQGSRPAPPGLRAAGTANPRLARRSAAPPASSTLPRRRWPPADAGAPGPGPGCRHADRRHSGHRRR